MQVTHGRLSVSSCFGGHSVRETPGYIPNPEAKPYSADGTAGGTLWESRTPPNNHSGRGPSDSLGPRPFVFELACTFGSGGETDAGQWKQATPRTPSGVRRRSKGVISMSNAPQDRPDRRSGDGPQGQGGAG